MNGARFNEVILEEIYDEWVDRFDYACKPPSAKPPAPTQKPPVTKTTPPKPPKPAGGPTSKIAAKGGAAPRECPKSDSAKKDGNKNEDTTEHKDSFGNPTLDWLLKTPEGTTESARKKRDREMLERRNQEAEHGERDCSKVPFEERDGTCEIQNALERVKKGWRRRREALGFQEGEDPDEPTAPDVVNFQGKKKRKSTCASEYSEPDTYEFQRCQRPDGFFYGAAPRECPKSDSAKSDSAKSDEAKYSETLDFATLCQRKEDGSYYGTAGQCRKGVEVNRSDVIKEIESKTKGINAQTKAKLESLTNDEIGKVMTALNQKQDGTKAIESQEEATRERLAKKVKETAGEDAKSIKQRVDALREFERENGEEGLTRLSEGLSTVIRQGEPQYKYSTTETGEEIKILQDSSAQSKLAAGYKDPSTMQKGGENAMIKFKDVSDSEVDAAWALMPNKVKASFDRAGKLPGSDKWSGKDAEGKDTHGQGGPERSKMLLKRWLEQDGKDGYTGLPLTLNNADLEHVIPFAKGGKTGSETPDNWLWTSASVNRKKGDNDMDTYLSKVNKTTPEKSQAVRDKTISKATSSTGKVALKAQLEDEGFLSSLQVAETRATVVDTYKEGSNKTGGLTYYLAGSLGRTPIEGASREVNDIRFVRTVGERGGANNKIEGMLQTNANWKTGRYGSGKMTAAEWIARNYPAMRPAQAAKFKRLYNQAATESQQAKISGQPVTATTFTQKLADLTTEAFSNEDY